MLQQVNTLQCNACRKIFSRESSLKRHLLTVHMGVRASRCFLCGRAFTQSGNMRSHQQGVHFFLPAGRKEQRRPQPPVKLVITRADGIYTCRPAGRRLFRRPSAARRPCCWWPWSLAATPGTRRCGAALVATIRESDKKKILIFFNVYNSSIFSPDLSASGDTPDSLLGRSRGPGRRVEAGLLTAVSRPVTFLPDWSKEANLVPPSQKKIFHF